MKFRIGDRVQVDYVNGENYTSGITYTITGISPYNSNSFYLDNKDTTASGRKLILMSRNMISPVCLLKKHKLIEEDE